MASRTLSSVSAGVHTEGYWYKGYWAAYVGEHAEGALWAAYVGEHAEGALRAASGCLTN